MRGVGIDVVDIEKVEDLYRRWGTRFLSRVLTKDEAAFCLSRYRVSESIAARIAAKEAFYKASGLTGYLPWKQIEVVTPDSNRPALQLRGGLRAAYADRNVLVSLSHTRGVAVAVVVVE
jgi:holo-[acyl-carrier protein] synthase